HSAPPLLSTLSFFSCPRPHRDPHSFPTRRSSDLAQPLLRGGRGHAAHHAHGVGGAVRSDGGAAGRRGAGSQRLERSHHRRRRHPDRKSTRLDSSHVAISYAVFCLKKKK